MGTLGLHEARGHFKGSRVGPKKLRNRVYGGHVRVTGIIHIAAVGISLGVLGVEFCLISEEAE